MDDLISRAAAIEALRGMLKKAKTRPGTSVFEIMRIADCENAIKSVPAVNAAPVVFGYWVEETGRYRHWHCSNCGKVQGITCVVMKYCPECGARMAEHPWVASGCGQAFSPD